MRTRGGPPKVVSVCYGGAHAATLAPVARELLKRGQVDVTCLALTTGAERFVRNGVPFRGYRDYVRLPEDAAAIQLGEELAATVNGQASGVAYEETVAYMGLSMAALMAECGEREARQRFATLGRHAFLQRSVLRRIFDLEQPNVVVATNSPKSERAAILVGNERGLTTLIVPDLLADPTWETYAPFEAQWFAAMNETARENLVEKHNADPARVIVTGQPAFDKSSVPPVGACKEYVSRELGIETSRPYVVVATTWNQIDPRRPSETSSSHAVDVLNTMLRLRCPFEVVVKPHPSEPMATYQAFAGVPGWRIARASSDINQLVRPAVALLGAGSTTAIVDAMSLSVPAAIVQLDGREPLLPARALSVDVLRHDAAIARWLASRKSEGQGFADLGLNTGSAERVAELIERLAVAP